MEHVDQLPRLNRIEGQIRGIKRMIEEGRYCIDVLTQLRAVSNALAKVQENVFKKHLEGCVRDSMQHGVPGEKQEKVDEILDLLSRFR